MATNKSYLDKTGLQLLWTTLKDIFQRRLTTSSTITISGTTIQAADHTYDEATKIARFTGQVHAPNGFFEISDLRKKKIISNIDINKCYLMVDKCQQILYILKDSENNSKQIGLIAQEVQEFFPEVVTQLSDGTLSLDYSRITVVILALLKDLIQQMQTLKQSVEELSVKKTRKPRKPKTAE